MRALELGKYLVRTTNTGTTAIIDHKGKVIKQLPKNTRAVLNEDVAITQGKTPFTYFGNLPILLVCSFIFALCSLLSLKNKTLSTKKADNSSTY